MIKKFLTLVFILTLGLTHGQKKELKKAIKLFEAGDVKGAKDLLDTNSSLFEGVDVKITNQKLYLEGRISQANKNFQLAYDKFKSFSASGGKDTNYDNQIETLTSDIVNSAIEDNAEKRFETATAKLYLAYEINPEQNKDYLYYAASSSVNARDFDSALKFYNLLKEIKYDGVVTKYMAKSAETGEDEEFPSKSEYDLYKKTKQYTDFREELTESRYPEIIKNIALIRCPGCLG